MIYYEIRNKYGDYVCKRVSLGACKKLLQTYATDPQSYPQWDCAPYVVNKVTIEKRYTQRVKK